MSHIAANADDYAAPRLNIFFPGITPDLDGQCVSLAKWFMQEMSDVPDPQAARGDARYVGHTLVAQGHAVEVPYSDRKRGDLICYEYGTYGHIGVVLSGDRTFEENVNWPGVASKIVDGARVYASRIGDLSESWRHDQHIYRLNTYYEGGDDMTRDQAAEISLYGRLGLEFKSVAEANQHAEDDINHILADPGYAGALLKQMYSAKTWQDANYKVVNYNKDVDAAYKRGLADGGGSATVLMPGKYLVQ